VPFKAERGPTILALSRRRVQALIALNADEILKAEAFSVPLANHAHGLPPGPELLPGPEWQLSVGRKGEKMMIPPAERKGRERE